MAVRCYTLVCIAMISSASAQPTITSKKGDDSVLVKTGDAAMTEAMRKARAGLKSFLALADSPQPSMRDFSVKIDVPLTNSHEYLWIRPFTHDGTRFVGRLVNTPNAIKNIRYGDRLAFEEKDVVDWSYVDGERKIGNYTACALIQSESPEKRAAFMQTYGLTCAF
jgi:uncharacterized protein YegJ (DUF2314 family)